MIKPELEVWSSELKPKKFCKRRDGKNRVCWKLSSLLNPIQAAMSFAKTVQNAQNSKTIRNFFFLCSFYRLWFECS